MDELFYQFDKIARTFLYIFAFSVKIITYDFYVLKFLFLLF